MSRPLNNIHCKNDSTKLHAPAKYIKQFRRSLYNIYKTPMSFLPTAQLILIPFIERKMLRIIGRAFIIKLSTIQNQSPLLIDLVQIQSGCFRYGDEGDTACNEGCISAE